MSGRPLLFSIQEVTNHEAWKNILELTFQVMVVVAVLACFGRKQLANMPVKVLPEFYTVLCEDADRGV